MKDNSFAVKKNRRIARDIFEMVLFGDTREILTPGQFVEVKLPGRFLRRPISVCSCQRAAEGSMTLVYKIVGEGTRELAEMAEGEKLRMLTGLGNGYDLKSIPEEVTLVGGGVGVPPLYGLCEELVRTGKHPSVVLGFQTKEDVFYRREFEALGVSVQVVTEDGREGIRGRVNDALSEKGYLCACGPLPMLRALVPFTREGQFSLEARMGCGFGACMGCSLETRNGAKRVCKEGPVFSAEEILWDRM